MGYLLKDLEAGLLQSKSILLREAPITSLYKVMIEGGVGALWRTDGHDGEVQVVDGAGGDRGGNGILLPLLVRLADKDSSPDEPKADNNQPKNLCWFCLKWKLQRIIILHLKT